MAIRVLLLADSHLGFDLPDRPRSRRRRRGPDFLANYAAALEPALAGTVDMVVHGGDVFDRPEITPALAYQALEPLTRVADRGVPVFVVPGNHERSRLPHHRFAAHPHVHLFDRPRTVRLEIRGTAVALTGFPCERREVRTRFPALLERTGWHTTPAALRLLCMHQCVEGATVGPDDFTFTTAPDVIRLRDIPPAFDAVVSGHIHRHQVLTRDLRGRPLAAPVFYPGSLERTSLAERGEAKGFLLLELTAAGDVRVQWEFRRLPARPMVVRDLAVAGMSAAALDAALHAAVAAAPADAVLRIRLRGDVSGVESRLLSATRLRRHAPGTMNIEIRTDAAFDGFRRNRGRRIGEAAAAPRARSDDNLQLDL
jgi:DNA repair protein SbcD/Mre11